ncbi:MAG: hypothetical protein ABI655_02345, partial [Phenylobacterium sp.]
MSNVAKKLRSNKELSYGGLMIAIGALLGALLAVGAWAAIRSGNPEIVHGAEVYVGYGVLIAAFYWIAAAVYRTTAFGNMILLGPQQFPQLHAMVVAGA